MKKENIREKHGNQTWKSLPQLGVFFRLQPSVPSLFQPLPTLPLPWQAQPFSSGFFLSIFFGKPSPTSLFMHQQAWASNRPPAAARPWLEKGSISQQLGVPYPLWEVLKNHLLRALTTQRGSTISCPNILTLGSWYILFNNTCIFNKKVFNTSTFILPH